ncbi:hypothetical protein BDR03DRAFT_877310, partial [Suillus americanus]
SIKTSFECKGKGKITYLYRESGRDCFNTLMKTGHPELYIPSAVTVACDVKHVFVKTHSHSTNAIGHYDGELNFATDAWTSPNHRAYVAISVRLQHEGQPLAMILDIVEVPKSHTDANLAEAFAKVLQDFGVSDKVYNIMIQKKNVPE